MRDRAEPQGARRLARRRAIGLRREEVALDAGISVTWYTWLEQGRPVRVSRRTLLDALAPHPAYAVNARWDVLHANAAATAMFGDFAARPGVTDNVLARLSLDEGWRALLVAWEQVVASAVAQIRAATGRMVGDAWWKAFVARLSAESDAFRDAWARNDLAGAVSWEKTLRRPDGVEARHRYASLAPDAEAADVRIVVNAPVNPR